MWDKDLILRRDLERISTEELRTILHRETEKNIPDDDLVLSILHILEEREPEILDSGSDEEKAAVKRFRKRVRARRMGKIWHNRSLMRAASIVLVFCLLFTLVPQQAEADSWWQRLIKWTDDFFGFFREEEEAFHLNEYEFRTDNPGLQQVYDAVVEMGVTVPAVPMWLPEGYELAECKAVETPVKQYVYALFLNNDQECVLKVNVLNTQDTKDYFKDEVPLEEIEKGGIIHSVVQNAERWVVSWTKDNVECSIFIDCHEDVLYEIIESIYRWRMNE